MRYRWSAGELHRCSTTHRRARDGLDRTGPATAPSSLVRGR